MQPDSSKPPATSTMRQPQLQPKHIPLASTPLIGQPLLPRLPNPSAISSVQNMGQFVGQAGYQSQQGMYVQGLFQGQIRAQGQRVSNMAVGLYQPSAQLYYSSSSKQTGQLNSRITSQQSTSPIGSQQPVSGVVPGMRLAYQGQSLPTSNVLNAGLQVPTIQPAVDTSKSVRTPAMIQPKIPVPLNLPRLHPAPQPAHGFQPSNAISPGNPMSAQMVPGTSNLPSVSLTQIPTPQFFSTPCNMMRSPVSPQFLTPQPQLSPMVPVSPTMFQVQQSIQPNQSFVSASSLAQIQPAMFSYSSQPCGLTTSPMSLSPQTPTGILAASPVNLSPHGGVLYSPATPGLSPVIMMQPQTATEISDQPTDLSLKSPREESKEKETAKDSEVNADKEKDLPSAKESFHESFLNLKQKDPQVVSTVPSEVSSLPDDELASPTENEDPLDADDVFVDGKDGSDKAIKEDVTTKEGTEIDTGDYNSDGIPVDYSDSEFVWEEYLQDTGVQAVPPTAFKHVEYSLQSGFVKGMKLEVPNKCTPGTYWVASVIMTCGPLLRLRYDGYEEDTSADFWCDLSSSEIHSIGWCAQNGQNLQPPEAIKFKFNDWREFLMTVLTGARTAPSYLLDKTTGTTPIDQLKPGMRLELQDYLNPLEVWLVKIIENIGGRLYLRLEGVESASKDFWMFYLHYRLHPIGWSKLEEGCTYKPPSSIEEEHTETEWKEILDTALKENELMALPVDVYKDQIEIQPHRFEEGMKLECVHPLLKNHIFPATVCKVFSNKYFLVEIDDLRNPEERSVVKVSCHGSQIGIFPITWCQSQGIKLTAPRGWIKPDFSWGEYLTYCNAKAAPDRLFSLSKEEHEFERGMKLEAVNPDNPNQICASTITKMVGPLLWVHLDNSVKGMASHIEDVDSFNLFPVGWCESNGYQLKPPRKISFGKKQHRRMSLLDKKDLNGEEYRSQTYHHVKSGDNGDCWCPKIYFNHKCFSGPYLSKGRIAELPKCVGPGPIELVMKEVLSMLCSVAYKSSRVLKEIQQEGPANPSMQQQVLKAKYKGKSYRAVVEVCRKVSQLEEFCRQVCIKLECCPYLFSPLFVEDNCPENCMQLTKTKYPYSYGYKKKKKLPVGRPPGGHTNLENGPKIPAKRGRKRKRFHLIHKKSHSVPTQKPEEENNGDQEEGSTNGENGDEGFIDDDRSGDNEVDNDEDNRSIIPTKKPGGFKRKYTHHIPAPSDIQTRGAKLPRYSFERKTHKKILLSHTSPPLKAKPKLEKYESAVSLPPSLTKEIYPKLPKNDDLHSNTNPLDWSVDDVIRFLKTTDCYHLARIIKEQEIDGQSFMLMSLPAIQEHLDLKLGPAVKLCHQIERVKLVFFEKFAK